MGPDGYRRAFGAGEMRNKKIIITGILQLLLAALLVYGLFSFAAPCEPRKDGSFLKCHSAFLCMVAVSCLLCALSLLRNILPGDGLKKGLSVAILPTCALTLVFPYYLFPLCERDNPMCKTRMMPFVIVVLACLFMASLVDIILNRASGYAVYDDYEDDGFYDDEEDMDDAQAEEIEPDAADDAAEDADGSSGEKGGEAPAVPEDGGKTADEGELPGEDAGAADEHADDTSGGNEEKAPEAEQPEASAAPEADGDKKTVGTKLLSIKKKMFGKKEEK